MPRYRYMCDECTAIVTVMHTISETLTDCPQCKAENSMKKMLSTPHIPSTNKPDVDASIGTITREYIELNRELLKEEKLKAQQEEHEPS
jgi:putative FmdB family regulatory protein